MAATKLSNLVTTNTISSSDLLVVVRDPLGTPSTNNITFGHLLANISSNVHFSGNVVGFSNTTLITFDNGGKLGANIEGEGNNGFEVSAPATLDYMGMSYGTYPANGYASYLTMNKTGSDLNRDHQLNLQLWRGTANGADGGLTQWFFNANGSFVFPDGSYQYTAFNTNTQYTFANTITFSSNVRVQSVIPTANLTYTLGNTTNRFASMYVGSNSITFTDTLGGPDQVLSVANQIFYITQGSGSNTLFNANAGFNAGGIILQNYNMKLANNSQNLVIGSTSVNTNVIVNQNLLVNTTLTFSDNTVQNTAYKVPSVRIANVISNTVTIDFSTDNFVHIHTNSGTVTANLQNLTAGKVVELFIYNNVGGTQQFNHGISSTQATGGSSFYLSSHNTMYVKYFCLDGNANNTFVTAIT